MKIIKDEQTKKYKALSLSQRQFEPFFEADSPGEAAMLVKTMASGRQKKIDKISNKTKSRIEKRNCMGYE